MIDGIFTSTAGTDASDANASNRISGAGHQLANAAQPLDHRRPGRPAGDVLLAHAGA
jgi:hypothetical protein